MWPVAGVEDVLEIRMTNDRWLVGKTPLHEKSSFKYYMKDYVRYSYSTPRP